MLSGTGPGVWGLGGECACVPSTSQSRWGSVTSAPAGSHHAPHPLATRARLGRSALQSCRVALWLWARLNQPTTYQQWDLLRITSLCLVAGKGCSH